MIRIGGTRFVFMTESHAYKIARVRPLKFLVRLLKTCFSKSSRERYRLIYGFNFSGHWHYVFAGYYANKREAGYTVMDDRVSRVVKVLFRGLVVVQQRAEFITHHEKPAWMPIPGTRFPRDYGVLNSQVVLIDLGDSATIAALRSSFKSV